MPCSSPGVVGGGGIDTAGIDSCIKLCQRTKYAFCALEWLPLCYSNAENSLFTEISSGFNLRHLYVITEHASPSQCYPWAVNSMTSMNAPVCERDTYSETFSSP